MASAKVTLVKNTTPQQDYATIKHRAVKKVIETLKYVGESFTNNARGHHGGWENDTDNLESSIGYVLAVDKKVTNSMYEGTAKGQQEGKKLAVEVLNKAKEDIVMVGTAGMDYALSLEAKGYDVITSKALTAMKLFKRLVSKMKGIKL